MWSVAQRVWGSQRSCMCWSQLGHARRLSLPNGKSIRVWWRLLNRPACPAADRDRFCCCKKRGFSSSYAAVHAVRSCKVWKAPLIPPGIFLAQCKCKQQFPKFSASRTIDKKDDADEIKPINGRWSLNNAIFFLSQFFSLNCTTWNWI